MPKKTCHCFIKHPTTKAERDAVVAARAYARSVKDPQGTMFALAQLTSTCGSR